MTMLKRIAVIAFCVLVFYFLLPVCEFVCIVSAFVAWYWAEWYRGVRGLGGDPDFEKCAFIGEVMYWVSVAASAAFSLFIMRTLWPEPNHTDSSSTNSD